MSKLDELAKLGQAVWYDYIRRSFLSAGDLKKLVDMGIRGITSNPAIFEKAISGSNDYDDAIRELVDSGKTPEEIYEILAVEDISEAADTLLPVYRRTGGRDGFVSLEVNPSLASDTAGTVAEGKRLYEAAGKPNLMIKVPATIEGIPAIAELIGSGVNVNVTLLFSVENYLSVAEAYMKGLEKLAESGPGVSGAHTVSSVASVASFFVSRIDAAVDALLEKAGGTELKGEIAIANAKTAYREFQRLCGTPRWQELASRGAKVQRLLWASTSTKNPQYPDTMYVDELIGRDTVNTVPPATFDAFLDHGKLSASLAAGMDDARKRMDRLKDFGIDLASITRKLQDDGVAAFSGAMHSLVQSISTKSSRLKSESSRLSLYFGPFQDTVDAALRKLKDDRILSRIWQHDHTIWKEAPDEISNRLGWLHSPEVMMDALPEIRAFVDQVRAAGLEKAVLLGMGGSSLAPEVFSKTFGKKKGYLDLEVLDSTDPGAVLSLQRRIDLSKTLFIVSTKSGGTVETFSFMKYFYNRALSDMSAERVGDHFVAITDPGSGLETAANQLNFRKIFRNDPNIGGRYSALSFFGLVPAALIGVDLRKLLERAQQMSCNAEGCSSPVNGANLAAVLGAALGESAIAGRDKLTFIISDPIASFGSWVEQLIAESTGKEGTGILPVDGEAVVEPEEYAEDRLFAYLRLGSDSKYEAKVGGLKDAGHPVIRVILDDLYDLGGQLFLWEMATVLAGARLGINPFDQPNVEAAKVLAREIVAAYGKEGRLPELTPSLQSGDIEVYAEGTVSTLDEAMEAFFRLAKPGRQESLGRSYVSLQAYVEPSAKTDAALQEFRMTIQRKFRLATTVGYGPRFLHSTGQLHKGDAGNGLFIQITAEMPEDIPIPDEAGKEVSSITFGVLKAAQALGDKRALLDNGRNVIRFHIRGNVAKGLKILKEAIC